ncbi:selenoprotein K-like [Peromyscus leucopus]|uniref:selenoprotein K-like n=1 Tax=Peromyscus leucopus TaxID=10041 RepID=UPI0018854071|nr:selenoprotein K-like [Peromyscus leucopus]
MLEWETGGEKVYIWNGQVLDSCNQFPWRLSFIADLFWEIAEFVLFCFVFKTPLQQDVKERKDYGSSFDSRYEEGRRPAGDSLGRIGWLNHLHGLNLPPKAGG